MICQLCYANCLNSEEEVSMNRHTCSLTRLVFLSTGTSVLLIKRGNYRPKGEITQEKGGLDSEKKKKTTQTHILKTQTPF